MWKPDLIAGDFETTGLEMWHPDFRVTSAAFSWFSSDGHIKNRFIQGEAEVGMQLAIIESQGIPLAAHNAQFEIAVTKARYPNLNPRIWQYDTMRLVQNYDGGGKDATPTKISMTLDEELAAFDKPEKVKTGLGLVSAASRILPREWHYHKEPYHKYLRETHGIKKGQEGANLHLLTPEMLKGYNTADTDTTLMLYDWLTKHFKKIGFNWEFDHGLHINACNRIAQFKIDGVLVDRDGLAKDLEVVEGEVGQIVSDFREYHRDEIEAIETERRQAFIKGVKSEHHQRKRREALQANAEAARKAVEFNPRSGKQLKELFVDRLGVEPRFWTKESKERKKKAKANPDMPEFVPSPSFRATHLPSYGKGGEILQNQKKRLLITKQQSALLKLSEVDSRWHLDIRACGARTSRYNGGGGGDVKLNALGLGRREPRLMKHIKANPGELIASVDLSSGEPTVVAHYSQDQNYRNASFEMVGKAPYWDSQVILQIDDQYLQGASVSPVGLPVMREIWNTTFNGNTFAEQWLLDPDVIKGELKKDRAFHKILILALMYGLAPRGMVYHAYDNGFTLNYADAKTFHTAFWSRLYPGVKRLGERLQMVFNRQGCLVNQFGYRMVPEQSRLCLNYQIQSSVSGIMKVLEDKFYSIADYAKPLPCVHDEILTRFPSNMLEQCRQDFKLATDSLNEDLGWSVKIRTGFAYGETWYEAK